MAKNRKQKKKLWLGLAAAAGVLAALMLLAALLLDRFPMLAALSLPRNPYGAEDFGYEDGYLTCLAGESVLGIDVSQHQGQIDWEAVREAGVEFAIIRVGYRGYRTGDLLADKNADANYAGAKAAGLKVGAYLFSQAVTVEEAREEAKFFLDAVKDWELEMWAVYDWEYVDSEARTAGVSPRLLTDMTKEFLDAVTLAGYQPMVYFNRGQSRDLMYMDELRHYGFWLAMYNDPMTYPFRLDMWQYTNTGSVPGISGNVDINLWLPR